MGTMGKWKTDLIKIDGTCCMAYCCPCVTTMQINEKLADKAVIPGGAIGGCLLGYCCFPCFVCASAPVIQKKDKPDAETDGIPYICGMLCCCAPCYLAQMRRELD